VKARIAVRILQLSAAGLVSLVGYEAFAPTATIPTAGDRPTVGFGSTFQADGMPVKMGDKMTPQRALYTAQAHIAKDEAKFRDSLPGVELYQAEYDVYIDWTYQYGAAKWMQSGMRDRLLAHDYRGACDALLKYRKIARSALPKNSAGWVVERRDASGKPTLWSYDCSTPGNKVCGGVWKRQQERHAKCIAAGDQP
jgi:lysozyme